MNTAAHGGGRTDGLVGLCCLCRLSIPLQVEDSEWQKKAAAYTTPLLTLQSTQSAQKKAARDEGPNQTVTDVVSLTATMGTSAEEWQALKTRGKLHAPCPPPLAPPRA